MHKDETIYEPVIYYTVNKFFQVVALSFFVNLVTIIKEYNSVPLALSFPVPFNNMHAMK